MASLDQFSDFVDHKAVLGVATVNIYFGQTIQLNIFYKSGHFGRWFCNFPHLLFSQLLWSVAHAYCYFPLYFSLLYHNPNNFKDSLNFHLLVQINSIYCLGSTHLIIWIKWKLFSFLLLLNLKSASEVLLVLHTGS